MPTRRSNFTSSPMTSTSSWRGQAPSRSSFDGRHLTTVEVNGVPRLYTLFSGDALQTGQLDLSFSPGVQAYDFTFG